MATVGNRAVFNEALLPEGQSRWGSFGAGFGLECIALAALVVIPLLMPQRLIPYHAYWATPISAPPVVAWKPQPQPKPIPVKQPPVVKEPPKVEEVVTPKPKIYTPVVAAPVIKPVRRPVDAPPLPEVAKVFPDQNPPNSMGSSAMPTLRKPREAVQTGGFGDPNGVPLNDRTGHSPNIAQAGSFDLPNGPGNGNGTGGAKGAKGVIASTGFGNGTAVGSPGGGSRGPVQSGVFADQIAAAAAPKIKADTASRTKPVEILFTPKPVYTDEGRAKKIEGDVVLQVIFKASGEVQVLRVVQGLGYGLDASAEAAAREIRFHPAQQDGNPVDFTANARIKFELAY